MLLMGITPSLQAQDATHHSTPAPEIIELTDGSTLHGKAHALSASQGLEWQHPLARHPVTFDLSHLARLRLHTVGRIEASRQPDCRFEFNNGDLIYGNLLSLKSNAVEFQTWFGGTMRSDRQALKRIAFLKTGYKVLYEGPNNIDEWQLGAGQNGWSYHDGKLKIQSRGVIGRDFQLKDSVNLTFDMRWDRPYQLSITLFTDTFNRFDYRQGSYIFFLSPQFVSFQRVQPGTGVLTLGQSRIETLNGRSEARFSIRAHRESSRFIVYINDEPVGRFRDNRGFVAQGKGISFSSQLSASSFELSNLLVTQWDGSDEAEGEIEPTPENDILSLVNQDRPKGTVVAIEDESIEFLLRKERAIRVPVERVKQIQFNSGKEIPSPPLAEPKTIRAHFAGGGSLSFDLISLDQDQLHGQSSTFGPMSFRSDSIRQIEFNLNHQALQKDEAADAIWNLQSKP
jgi:hypothetical protein